jgi:hypothetical protein
MFFSSVEQRIAQTYIDTFPEFEPAEKEQSVKEQETFYNIIRGLYQLAYTEPALFVNTLHEDDFFTRRFNKTAEAKPELLNNMKSFIKNVDDLLEAMFRMGKGKDVSNPNKKQRVILERLGVNETSKLPNSWIWMATRNGADVLSFSKCLFNEDHPYTKDVFARMLGDQKAFYILEEWLTDHGYTRFEYLDGRMSLDYANLAWDKTSPRGGFVYKVRHSGISVSYDSMIREPQVLGLCIPGGLKKFLETFDIMSEIVKEFVVEHTKHCDACDYCIQTDKSRTRPRAFIPVKHKTKTFNLCPLFPGYRNCWTSINEALVDNLIAVLSFVDSFLSKRKIK